MAKWRIDYEVKLRGVTFFEAEAETFEGVAAEFEAIAGDDLPRLLDGAFDEEVEFIDANRVLAERERSR